MRSGPRKTPETLVASTPRQPTTRRAGVSSRRILVSLTTVAVVMAIVGAYLFIRYGERAAGNPHRLAIAPFDLPDEPGDLLAWRVGLATGLTERLAADGRLETVSQADVAAIWQARETPIIAAVELARRTGAGLAVYGRVEVARGDSLMLRAAVLDAYRAAGVFEVAVPLPPGTGLDAASDSLAAALQARWGVP